MSDAPYIIGGGAAARRAVHETFAALPADVQWALGAATQVVIVKGGGARAVPLPRAPEVQWLVVMAEPALQEPGAEWLVSHELAHCALNHRMAEGDGAAQEEAANQLAKRWGFERSL